MLDKVLNTIKKYNLIENGDKVIVGVSGGPDSMCLLNVLNSILKEEKLKFEILVCHVNHEIREESDSDEEFVRNYCFNNSISFYSKHVDVLKIAKEYKKGTEEIGREIRYSFFNEILKKENASKIATAHTKSDNSETVLMNIIRGCGISGLKGIEPIRDNKFIRPLIDCSRDEIEQYCMDKKLNPRIDKTNFENIYTRNKVRNLLIPYIKKEFNPNIEDSLYRLSNIVREENRFIEQEIEEVFKYLKIEQNDKEIVLDLKKFNKLDKVIKSRVVLYTFNILFGTSQGIEKIHIEDIIKLCENNVGNKFLIPNKNKKVLVKNKKIFFIMQ